LLSKLADEYQGAFILAKVNADQQQELVAKAGVRNLPTAKLYKNGVVVDEFVGAKPESELRQFLNAHVENETDNEINKALSLSTSGEYTQAVELLKSLNQKEPDNTKIHISIAKVYLQSGDYDNCEAILKALPANVQVSDDAKKLQHELALLKSTSDAPEIDEILLQLEKNPENHELRIQLANQYMIAQQYEQALESLHFILAQDVNFQEGAAREAMLKIFGIMGAQEPLVRQYRSKLAILLN
jgi:putative thioredoxin